MEGIVITSRKKFHTNMAALVNYHPVLYKHEEKGCG